MRVIANTTPFGIEYKTAKLTELIPGLKLSAQRSG
ncbi:hypothetical protein BH09VER1_BH09VER1_06090 [soil metagenome]